MRVIFATDGSDSAKDAAQFLSTMSFQEKPELTLLTVGYDPEETAKHKDQPWIPEWRDKQRKFVAKLHGELEVQFSDQCASISKLHLHGNAAHQILEQASQTNADLIILGAVGHSMIGRMFLGSVSDNVATHADCSVLVVRPDASQAADASQAESEPKAEATGQAQAAKHRITVAYDGSAASREAIEELSKVSWDAGRELNVLTVAQDPTYLLAGGISTSAIMLEEQMFEQMRKTCDSAAHEAADALADATSQVVRGHHIGDAIVRTAAENKSDLIVVGDSGHNLVEELIVGSTAKYVLRHAACSVWISRHHRS